MLLRNGTLPRVWIPPAELRDQREMLRLRMSLVRMKTQLKNRIHGVLLRYNLCIQASDLFGDQGERNSFPDQGELPAWSHESVLEQLQMVDAVQSQIVDCEKQLEVILYPNVERDLL